MKKMTSSEARRAFLDYFEEVNHKEVASSSLVPANDPTLLFTNAGMVQFKDVFLGTDKRNYSRATTSQKVMRAGGKHNDLDEVGPSPRHHTFFEMLGNFSFGDYFKLEAMQFAWDVLTKVYELPVDRLAVTIYEKDDESYDLWTKEIGVAESRIARLGPKDNFWQMAETGPCGPNTEIHWDKFPELGEDGIIKSLEEDDDRFLEIWNLVFMQFNRTQPDPEFTGDHDDPLPDPGVDTGMGLERIVSVLQGVTANYETDLFTPIIEKTRLMAGQTEEEAQANYVPYRVIADHIRAAVFLISDGVLPGAKGRDSVCRLVIRRAARFGQKLGFEKPFLADVADSVIEIMGDHYTELIDKADAIKKTITKEEEMFRRTLDRGMAELEAMLADLEKSRDKVLSGDDAFFLKATLGLPIQATRDIAEERGFTVDMDGYERAEEQHALDSGAGQAMGVIESVEAYSDLLDSLKADGKLPDSGVDYEPYGPTLVHTDIVSLTQNGVPVKTAIVGDKVEIVLKETHFYVESGGQVSDTGTIEGDGWIVEVERMSKPVTGLIVHHGEVVEGSPTAEGQVIARVDDTRRKSIVRNHTGTHLLHAALRNNLGTHVEQRGSLVAPERLRFDFVHDEKVTPDEIRTIQNEINEIILRNYDVTAKTLPYNDAVEDGAMALFGEKYGDEVRTIRIDDGTAENRYSYELCGGVHVRETSEIGSLIITSEGSSSAGVRRIEAVTGETALQYAQAQIDKLSDVARTLGTTPDDVSNRVSALQGELADTRREVDKLQRELAQIRFRESMQSLDDIGGVPGLVSQFSGVPMNTLREMADWFRNEVDSGVVVLGSVVDDKPLVMVSVSDDLTKKGLHAGNIVREVAKAVGGGGGGKPNMAQAGGKDADKLPDALNLAKEIIADSYSG
ncbi:MAG: alanine--tRNA ligase [Chloroflexota bacterium]